MLRVCGECGVSVGGDGEDVYDNFSLFVLVFVDGGD